MPKFTAMKFKVNDPEHSKQIQECLFKLGYRWCCGYKSVQHITMYYLFTEEDGLITHGFYDTAAYNRDKNKETTLEELQAMLGDVVKVNEQEPVDDSIPEHNTDNTMTQFLHQLQKRITSVNLAISIYSDRIELVDENNMVAIVDSYESLLEAIEVKEQFINIFKEIWGD